MAGERSGQDRGRPRVHVDWHAYGICFFWMLGGANRCYSGDQCRNVHPPRGEISRLWEVPEARLEYATKVSYWHDRPELAPSPPPRGVRRLGAPPPPPPNHPVSWDQHLDREPIDSSQIQRPSQAASISPKVSYHKPIDSTYSGSHHLQQDRDGSNGAGKGGPSAVGKVSQQPEPS